MKKYILTTLLGIIGMTAFTSANTIDNLTSQNIIGEYNFEGDFYLGELDYESLNCGENCNSLYFCIDTNDTNYDLTFYNNDEEISISNITNNPYCAKDTTDLGDLNISIFDSQDYEKYISGKLYFSISPITIQNTNGGGTSTSNGQLIPGGTSTFTPIITRLGSIAGEFIPYLLYIALGALGITLAYKAVKYIISYLSGKAKGAVRGR